MTRKLYQDHRNQCRSLRMESLEERQLLAISPADIQSIRDTYGDFSIASNVNIIEIEAEDLTTSALKAAINTAKQTVADDLIVVHTTNLNKSVFFSQVADELVIDTALETSGSMTIVAYGDRSLTIDAKSFSRIFTIKSGAVQLGNLTLTGGNATTNLEGAKAIAGVGGAIANAGTLTLSNVSIRNNQSDCGKFNDNNIRFNSKGGGIYNAGSLTIVDSIISNNVAKSGQINSNDLAAYGAGGGIFNDTNAILSLRNTTISSNTAEYGIRVVQPQTTSEDEHPVAIKVELLGSGGGIYNFGATMISTDSIISNNSAWFGGGISSLYNTKPSSVALSESRITGNYAWESGGGLYTAQRCTVNLNRSFIQGNTAGSNGGGITNRGELSLINSVLSGNSAGTDGGGLYSYGTYNSSVPVYPVKIVNSTITGNSSGTTTSGYGGGLYFEGVKSGNNFATLDIVNSIIVHNRIEKPDNSASDENIYKIGICRGDHSLTTFADWSNSDATNDSYDENVPLFTEEYNFTAKTEGDYRLVYSSQSQALDTGNNEAAASAGLNSNSLDLSGRPRIQGTTIDLGAYEFQPTPFDPAFPTLLSVQQGCSFNLQCKGTDRAGNSIVKYYVDLDGDGNIDKEGNDLWVAWRELSNRSGNKGYFWLTVENALGELSESKKISVKIIEVSPCIQVRQIKFYHDQILKLCMDVRYYDRSVKQWTIDWGDGTTPTLYNCLSSSLNVTHYYTPQSESIAYNITLSLVDTNDRGGDIVYYIGSHTILVDDPLIQTNGEPDQNTHIYSFATENWYDAEKTGATSSSNLCWAGSSANILYYTGWASGAMTDKDLHSCTFESEDDVMNYFVNHFTNGSGSLYYAADWFLTGNYNAPTSSGWAQNDVNGGGFYTNVNIEDVRKYYTYKNASKPEAILPEVAELLVDGYGIGLSLGVYNSHSNGTLLSGHAVTLWGFTADTNYNVADPEYYTSLKITDSDDDKYYGKNAPDNLITVDLTWNPNMQKYQILNYGSDSRTYWIEEFVALAPKSDPLLTATIPDMTTYIEPLLAAALWEQENHSEPLGNTHLLCPVRIESKTPVSASTWQYQPLAVAGLNGILARDAAITSLWDDDSDVLEGINTASYHSMSSSLKRLLESELFGNDDLDDLLMPYWE